jgi:prepilin-type N-terminal cleavage/methylation domain-containing protein
MPDSTRRGTEGFSLFELMAVIAIVAIVAALAMPAMSDAMASRRANEATHDLVRVARRARSEAAAYGLAHLLRYDDSNNGSVEIWRGTNDRCGATNWGSVISGNCGTQSACLGSIVMSDQSGGSGYYQTGSMELEMTIPDFDGGVDVCYEPHGVMMWRDGHSGTFSDQNTINGGVRVRFRPLEPGTTNVDGVVRWVVLPLGTGARVVR